MHSWSNALTAYGKPKIFIFLFLGFSCGLPYNLLGYSLSLWLKDTGFALSVVGLFSLVFIPYSLKFLWAPFVDRIRLPYLSQKLGQKKAWALVFQIGLVFSIFALAGFPPDKNTWTISWEFIDAKTGLMQTASVPVQTYLFALLTAFFACSQDIVVDALRIDTLAKEELGEGAGAYQFGYRMGLLLSGAGVVALSAYISWSLAYFLIGCFVITGFISIFFVREFDALPPQKSAHLLHDMIITPFADFMKKNGWFLILIFIVLYKLCNAVLGRMALPFYDDIGFSKEQIALVSGAFGPWITMAGIPIGGMLVMRYGILKSLFGLGFVEILTSLAFAGLALLGANMPAFFCVIVFDNIVGGMGGAVFVAYLSSLCSRAYSATQYALLTSLMAVASSVVASYSGFWAEDMGWSVFFVFTGALMIPALCLLWYLMHREKNKGGYV